MADPGAVLEKARALRQAGFADNTAGNPRRAARRLKAALRLLPELDQVADHDTDLVRVSCLVTLAVSELATLGLPAALARLDQARDLAGEDPELRARWRCQRGFLLGRSGNLGAAAEDLAAALAEPQWFTPAELASTLLNQGMVLLELGRPGPAEASFEAAAEHALQIDHLPLQFMAEHNRGFAAYLAGDLAGALAAMSRADDLPAEMFRGPSQYDLGKVFHDAGLLDEAVAALDRGIALCRPRQDGLLRAELEAERARVLRLTGDLSAAASSARSARDRFTRLGARALAARAEVTRLDVALDRGGPYQDVVAGALAAEQTARELGDTDLAARAVCLASEAALRMGEVVLAGDVLVRHPATSFGLVGQLRLDHAAALVERAAGRSPQRRLNAAAARVRASQATSAALESRAARKVLSLRLARLDLDVAMGRGPGSVLTALERWSGHGLPVVRPPSDPEQAELVQRLRALTQSIRSEPDAPRTAARRAEVTTLRSRLTRIVQQQRQDGAAASEMPRLGDTLTALERAGRDLIWLFSHDGGVWGVGVVGGRRTVRRLAEVEEVTSVARRVAADLRVVGQPRLGPLRTAVESSLNRGLAYLDDRLIAPWALSGAGVVLVGCHAVASVPWGMLPSLRGHPVVLARSASGWASGQASGRRGEVSVLAGPGLDHATLEAGLVADRWSVPWRVGTASDLVAGLADAEVVHVAAHGRHRADSPLFSCLELADGEVFAHELPVGDVRAGHVVLSACEVGTTQMRPGDEPLGLASTLLALGVNSVVAAVGPVADDASVQVMGDYHAALARGVPSDEALALAGSGTPFLVLGASWQGRPAVASR